MKRDEHLSGLSRANHIYLYELLLREIGVGRQTFAEKIEEVLARDGLSTHELGFEDTGALLRELEDFLRLNRVQERPYLRDAACSA